MKTVEVTLYEFNELDDAAKEKAREWWREASAGDDRHTHVWEDAKTILGLMGFTDCGFGFTGFWSQGDGAHFTGKWSKFLKGRSNDAGRLHDVKEYAPQDTELHRIAKALDEFAVSRSDEFRATITQFGHYSHERTMYFDYDGNPEEFVSDELTNKFEELCRDFARWLYKTLEKEYEYQTSDECIDETIVANAYTFLADGTRFKA